MVAFPGTRWIIIREPWRDSVDLYLIRDSHRGPEAAVESRDGGLSWEPVDEGAKPSTPLLSLPTEVVEKLARALHGVVPASDATQEHLKDAREVRDRLLALIETERSS